jgi:hypothetical protein
MQKPRKRDTITMKTAAPKKRKGQPESRSLLLTQETVARGPAFCHLCSVRRWPPGRKKDEWLGQEGAGGLQRPLRATD